MKKPKTPASVTHTPGPWRVAADDIDVVFWDGAGGEQPGICLLRRAETSTGLTFSPTDNLAERLANAKLIAAAPELLRDLKQAVECMQYCRRAAPLSAPIPTFPVEAIWMNTIDKAEGRMG